MKAGKLRHSIIIQTRTDTADSYGEPIPAWSTFLETWASIDPISGREFFSSKEVKSEVSHKVRIRWAEGITTQMRVLFGTRTFDIESVINIEERDRELLLMCVEVGI
jgi:SPP1 family predicted phage head-tail adaptor